MNDAIFPIPRSDAWGARAAAAGTPWGRYLARNLDQPQEPPDIEDPDFSGWQRYMTRDCLHLASAIAGSMRLPIGRLTKGGQLAHAFVILPTHDGVPDRWPCLDWSGVRTLKRMRADMREAWGRLAFGADLTGFRHHSDALRDARSRPHIAAAMRLAWPTVSRTLHRSRVRYLDVLDLSPPPRSRRRPDVIDVR